MKIDFRFILNNSYFPQSFILGDRKFALPKTFMYQLIETFL